MTYVLLTNVTHLPNKHTITKFQKIMPLLINSNKAFEANFIKPFFW